MVIVDYGVQTLNSWLFRFQKDKAICFLFFILCDAGVEIELVGKGIFAFEFEVCEGIFEFDCFAILVSYLDFNENLLWECRFLYLERQTSYYLLSLELINSILTLKGFVEILFT